MTNLTISVRFAGGEWTEPLFCYFCYRQLTPPYNYSCAECGRQTCDYDQEACQELDCEYDITCRECMEIHRKSAHELSCA
jgi:hypothetical protein